MSSLVTQDVGTTPAIISHSPLRPFLQKIIDKKVHEIALNVFERIVDYLCTKFYTAYRSHRFSLMPSRQVYNGVFLYDHTTRQCVTIKNIGAQSYICVDDKIVTFNYSGEEIALGLKFETQSIRIKDHPHLPKSVTICEEKKDNTYRRWNLDTTSETQKILDLEHFSVDNPEEGSLLLQE